MLLNMLVSTEEGNLAYVLLAIIYVELACGRYFMEGL